MDQLNQERRGMFDGLRVPFDLNMLVLAIVCVAGYLGLMWLTQVGIGDNLLDSPSGRILEIPLVAFFLGGKVAWHGFTYAVVIVVSLVYWAFFSTAISRIAAMKIAREETLSLGEACRFASKKFGQVAASVIFVAAIFFGFYALNATIFGWLGWIPRAGEVIVSLLFFLPLLFTFFFTFALVLGLFGFNLAASAIATESSDTWDGISRSWNYILVRPWQVLLTYGLSAAYLVVFLTFAGAFLDWSVSSLSIGGWGMGEGATVKSVVREDLTKSEKEAAGPTPEKEVHFAVPDKVDVIRSVMSGSSHAGEKDRIWYQPKGADHMRLAEYARDRKIDIVNLDRPADVTDLVPSTLFFAGWVIWLWLWACKLAICGYALQYFFGATTTLYFLLRKDVEGEEYGEIVVEEEELEEEASWDVKEPAKPAGASVAGPAAAGALIMPTALKSTSAGAANGGPGSQAAGAPAAAPAPTAPEGEKK
jgi:hypothetical protein